MWDDRLGQNSAHVAVTNAKPSSGPFRCLCVRALYFKKCVTEVSLHVGQHTMSLKRPWRS